MNCLLSHVEKIGNFEKVSKDQFITDVKKCFPLTGPIDNIRYKNADIDNYISKLYDEIILPERSTKKSAGYDFYNPVDDIKIKQYEDIVIPTGIKAYMIDDWVLTMHIRSSLAIKKGLQLSNCVGIIDADYYNNDGNEGNILIKLINTLDKDIIIPKHSKFCQGIFLHYGVTIDDNPENLKDRQGGIGSTGE